MRTSRSDIRNSRVIFGYLPLALAAAAVLVMVFVAPRDRDESGASPSLPTAAPESVATQADVPQSSDVTSTDTATSGSSDSAEPVAVASANTSAATEPAPATPSNTSATATTAAGVAAPVETGEGTSASGWGESVAACSDRRAQLFSVYSPPCFEFTGDNGGATAHGVTADEITVTYRHLADGNLISTLSALAGSGINEDAETFWRTTEGLVEYFNNTYEFYGRRIVLQRFTGVGSSTAEVTGGGQENAANDALTARDHDAFADVNNGFTSSQPYSEALTASGIISFGTGYMSREWYTDRGPYAWTAAPDCSRVAEVSADVAVNILLPEPAVLAGGELHNQPRRLGVVHPNNPEYTRCTDQSIAAIEAAGYEVALRQNYTLDLAQTGSNATAILARLKDANITSVACACDPLMMQALASRAEDQEYYPEWFIVGVGYIDFDLVGQIIANTSGSQWTRAIGGSAIAAQEPFGTTEGYRAYRSVRDDEPSIAIDVIYAQLLRLAIGIQMAGPNLTPETFEQGMYNYPEQSGPLGTWDFSPDNHSGIVDARLIFWHPDLPSTFNGELGTYVDTGERFRDVSEAPSQIELLFIRAEAGIGTTDDSG